MHLYLHGFASGANSRKADFFIDRYGQQGVQLVVPDFNVGGFTDFTISRQLAQAASYLQDEPVTLIFSKKISPPTLWRMAISKHQNSTLTLSIDSSQTKVNPEIIRILIDQL